MRYLVDTHTLLWYSQNAPELPVAVAEVLQQLDAVCYISRASLIEIAIKLNIGKLTLISSFALWLQKVKFSGFRLLEIQNSHLLEFQQLPLHHRDPFDRLLIAQALTENLTLVRRDGKFAVYTDAGLRTRWT